MLPSGAKAPFDFAGLYVTAKLAAEKVAFSDEIGKEHPSGAKARPSFAGFTARLKSCPFTKPLRLGYSATCKAVTFQNRKRFRASTGAALASSGPD
jgi:hypothetical protein